MTVKTPLPGGTTSACAENTCRLGQIRSWWGNYLRVRGEYRSQQVVPRAIWELPPRARRILPVRGQPLATPGTTSACAENTIMALTGCFSTRNYLRVRGEYDC